jgi:outer membrane receptor for Fe3+-dicitrate
VSADASYGSGLPFEFTGTEAEATAAYGERITSRVNFETGRVRPSFAADASVGFRLRDRARERITVQLDVRNITGRLNVINFAGLFSGTALAAPRSAFLHVRAAF